MALSTSNQDYNNCVANCKALFSNSDAALVACINGCAKVNGPADAGVFTDLAAPKNEFQRLRKMRNMKRIRSVIATGLQDHQREADIDKFYSGAESLVKSFEQSTKLNIEDDGVHVTKINLGLLSKDPERNVSIAYSRRHVGLFPFPHDHCTVKFCFNVIVEGEAVEICVEIEYPCNIDWPIIGRF